MEGLLRHGTYIQPVKYLEFVPNRGEGGVTFDARFDRSLAAAPPPLDAEDLPEEVRKSIARGHGSWRRAGLGFFVFRGRSGSDNAYYDPFRNRHFRESELFPDGRPAGHEVVVRPGRWLVLDMHPFGERYALDPETGERAPLPWLTESVRIGPLLRDGGLLIANGGEVVRLDPETGDGQPVSFRGATPRENLWPHPPWGRLIDATGYVLCASSGQHTGYVPARFDPATLTLHLSSWRESPPRVIAVLDDGSATLIENERRLVRIFFDDRPPERLFPRSRE
ncbi:MAG: hypothetical protein AB1726_05450 [Planctomycetota bacterium]